MSLRVTSPLSPVLGAVLAGTLLLAGCGGDNGSAGDSGSNSNKQVVLLTHDSWAAPDDLISSFEKESGYKVKVEMVGDAGELVNKLVLTKDSPLGDVVFGIDNTFATRALDEGVVDEYRSGSVPEGQYDVPGSAKFLTPIDWGDVCVNVDDAWFASKGLAEPVTLDDLLKPEYENLFVAPGAATSSPGFAFLLATIGKYGDAWKDYWTKLMANGAELTSGWEDAYSVDFTAGGGNGDRPIVLSYNSSPPFTIPDGQTKPTTSALLDTCFRQVEYAGVLRGAENEAGAKAFVDFLSTKAFQESLPDNMYVFPVDADATLPDLWAQWAKPATTPITVDADEIAKNRQDWLTEWSDITSR